MTTAKYLLWLDLETTGLNPDTDQILEIACVITDEELIAKRSFQAVIHPVWKLSMDTVVAAMHAENGLLEEVHASKNTLGAVEAMVLEQIAAVVPEDAELTIAGATIHFDKNFLRVHMPTLHARLHYRTFDVSSLKAAASMWVCQMPKSNNDKHRAMGDVEEALGLARRFMRAFLRAGSSPNFSAELRGDAIAEAKPEVA